MYLGSLAMYLGATRTADLLCAFPAALSAASAHPPHRYNVYGGNQDLEAVFGDVDRFLRWRVAFMEKSVELLDFTTVDQAIQVHGTFIPLRPLQPSR
jgi:hypothetical protein